MAKQPNPNSPNYGADEIQSNDALLQEFAKRTAVELGNLGEHVAISLADDPTSSAFPVPARYILTTNDGWELTVTYGSMNKTPKVEAQDFVNYLAQQRGYYAAHPNETPVKS